jgi:hypothetical protein
MELNALCDTSKCGIRVQRQRLKRFFVYFVAIATFMLFASPISAIAASKDLSIAVYRDPNCHCCGGWIDALATQGFQPQSISTDDMDALKQQYKIPTDLQSCHTAIVDGYVVEGHVPAEDIKRLLTEKPDVVGIAVPGMPIGTPGMESESGEERESFTVFSFDRQGNSTVFEQHSF